MSAAQQSNISFEEEVLVPPRAVNGGLTDIIHALFIEHSILF